MGDDNKTVMSEFVYANICCKPLISLGA